MFFPRLFLSLSLSTVFHTASPHFAILSIIIFSTTILLFVATFSAFTILTAVFCDISVTFHTFYRVFIKPSFFTALCPEATALCCTHHTFATPLILPPRSIYLYILQHSISECLFAVLVTCPSVL